jgi:hypothetical protein
MSGRALRRLTILLWLILAGTLAGLTAPRAWTGASWDTDDFMRLVQVRDLLAGQGWKDVVQHRLDPPGVPMHWSRLPDILPAMTARGFSTWLDGDDALVAAAMLLPPLYLLALLFPYVTAARLLVGTQAAPIALLAGMASSSAVAQFLPGRIDHHGLQLVLMTWATTLLLAGLAWQRWRRAIACAGVPFALSLWTGVEGLPFMAAWFAAFGCAWVLRGDDLARDGARAAALALAVGTAALLFSVPAARLATRSCDAFSVVPLAVPALVALGFTLLHMMRARLQTAGTRFAAGIACAAVAGVTFALLFPACAAGAYAGLDPLVREHWLGQVIEAQPIQEIWGRDPWAAIAALWSPALGFGYSAWQAYGSTGRRQVLWTVVAVLVATATLPVVWQVRVLSIAQTTAMLPVAALVIATWKRIASHGSNMRRLALLLPVLFAASVGFWPAIKALAGARGATPPASASVSGTGKCADRRDIAALSHVPPGLILNYVDVGPMLLFASPHAVLGAPYHRNVEGLRTTIETFRSADDASIRTALEKRGIGWVVTCPGVEERLVYRTATGRGLAERLAAGNVPAYLEPIVTASSSGLRVYRVRLGSPGPTSR